MRPGTSTENRQRIAELERENRELRRANNILKAASPFFRAKERRVPRRAVVLLMALLTIATACEGSRQTEGEGGADAGTTDVQASEDVPVTAAGSDTEAAETPELRHQAATATSDAPVR